MAPFARLAALFALTLCATLGATAAQAATPPDVVGSPPPPDKADITVEATIHADSVRYDVVNGRRALHVRGPANCGGYRIDRTNIPQHPKPGVTYRNVTVHARLAASVVNGGRTSNNLGCSAAPGPRPSHTPLHH